MSVARMARSRLPLTVEASGAERSAVGLLRGCPLPHPEAQALYTPDASAPGGHDRVHPPVLGGLGRELS
jgi:hypothetical protein